MRIIKLFTIVCMELITPTDDIALTFKHKAHTNNTTNKYFKTGKIRPNIEDHVSPTKKALRRLSRLM